MEKSNINVKFKDFPHICRVCLSTDNLKPFSQFFALFELFQNITNIQIEPLIEVNQPKNVCTVCIDQLENISSFISLSKSNDSHLRQLINESNSKTEFLSEETKVDFDEIDSHCYSDSEINIKSEKDVESVKPETDINNDIKQDSELTSTSVISQSASCHMCGEQFVTKNKLVEHQRKNFRCKKTQFNCLHCEKAFSTQFKLKLHMRSHTKEAPFQCSICMKKFRHSSNLKRHDDTVHKGLKPFKCDVCGKEYSRLAAKNEHMYSHRGEHPYICVYCGKRFRTYSNHFYHIHSHKVNSGAIIKTTEQKSYTTDLSCKICNKHFSSKFGILQHLQIHGERKFLCPICGKSFIRKCQLEDHSKLHTGEKPYICKYCGKSFRLTTGYKKHILVHTGEKPYQCKVCKKSFVQSTHLRKHMKMHTGEKPYSCAFCGKSFAERCNLKVHIRIHTGERPYHCSVCGLTFCDLSNMKKHTKSHSFVKQEVSLNPS